MDGAVRLLSIGFEGVRRDNFTLLLICSGIHKRQTCVVFPKMCAFTSITLRSV